MSKPFWGRAPEIIRGEGSGWKVLDLWCHMWFTRFTGSKEECEAWAAEAQKPFYGRLTLKIVEEKQ